MNNFAVFGALLSRNFQNLLTYRLMVLIWMFESFFFPITMLFVWIRVSQSAVHVADQLQVLINYYALVPLFSVLTGAWHGGFLAERIRSGELNSTLAKPMFPLIGDMANNIGEKILKLFYIVPFVFVAHLYFGIDLQLGLGTVSLTILALVLGVMIAFTIETVIGLLTFWMDEVSSIENFHDIIQYTFGGRIAPLFLFPPAIKFVAEVLPFRYVLSFPLEILVGSLTNAEISLGFGVLIFWLVIFGVVAWILWRQGIRRYSAYGG